jgi:hypothetical protein
MYSLEKGVNMPDRTYFRGMKQTLHRVANDMFDRVDELTQIGKIRLRIGMMKGEIKDLKYEIGDLVYHNIDQYANSPEILAFMNKIRDIEADLVRNEEEIAAIKARQNQEKD